MNRHKSTTHEERFFHIRDEHFGAVGTVFARKEDDGKWYGSVAIRDWRDAFNRRTGRVVARRKYFNGKRKELGEVINYDLAENFFVEMEHQHFNRRYPMYDAA